jgi:serine palmitoyltransferase
MLLMIIGHLRDWVGKRLFPAAYSHLRPSHGYAPLFRDEIGKVVRRGPVEAGRGPTGDARDGAGEAVLDAARPVTGVAGRTATCLDRTPTNHFADFVFTGETTPMRSFNRRV